MVEALRIRAYSYSQIIAVGKHHVVLYGKLIHLNPQYLLSHPTILVHLPAKEEATETIIY